MERERGREGESRDCKRNDAEVDVKIMKLLFDHAIGGGKKALISSTRQI